MKTDAFVQQIVAGCDTWPREAPARGCAAMSRELYPYTALFEPITLNRTPVKNRIVMAPMGNIDMCEETGRPNDKMLQYFFARAKGGAGLLTTGLVPVSHGIDNSITELGTLSYFPRIDRSRTVFSGWRDLAQGVHSFGSRIFIQLTAGLGRVGNPQCLINSLKFPVSASFNPNFYMSDVPCWRLSDGKCRKIVKNIGQAAADAKAAGLDGVYLHGHEGYLLEQMTNRAFNRRRLGRYADWQRFGIDMVREIRRRTDEHYPIMYRIDLSLALNETYGDQGMAVGALKKFRDGRTVAETLAYMDNLVAAGVDLFDVDLGCYDNWWLPHPPASMPAGCFVDVAALVREHFRSSHIRTNAGQEVPVAAVGKLGYPDLAERTLREEKADLILLGRPLLADPEWPNKVYAGRVEDIVPCIGCQEGCLNEFVDGGHPQCAVNPRTAFEDVYPAVPAPASPPKRIAVVGGGPAGIMAACTAAQRGHAVTLYEKRGALGGKLLAGGVPNIKFDVRNYLAYLLHLCAEAQKAHGLTLCLGTEASSELLQKERFDAVVCALGTRETAPAFTGEGRTRAVQATELLQNPALLDGAERVVVVGGGVVGCETAAWLAVEHKKQVSVVELLPYFMDGACTANRGHLLHILRGEGVQLFNCSKVTGFEGNKVVLERNTHKNVPNPYNSWAPILPKNVENPLAPKLGFAPVAQRLDADLVVLALGGRPDDALFCACQKARVAPELYNIGDSFAAGRVHEATRSAYALACRL